MSERTDDIVTCAVIWKKAREEFWGACQAVTPEQEAAYNTAEEELKDAIEAYEESGEASA